MGELDDKWVKMASYMYNKKGPLLIFTAGPIGKLRFLRKSLWQVFFQQVLGELKILTESPTTLTSPNSSWDLTAAFKILVVRALGTTKKVTDNQKYWYSCPTDNH